MGGRQQLRGVFGRSGVDQHRARLWHIVSVLDKAAGLILQMLQVAVGSRKSVSNVVGG